MTNEELKAALVSGCPVESGEIVYKCVSAIIYRYRNGKLDISAEGYGLLRAQYFNHKPRAGKNCRKRGNKVKLKQIEAILKAEKTIIVSETSACQ